mgnify:CR=1 FL=1
MFTKRLPGFMAAKAAASKTWWVCVVAGAWIETTSEVAKRVSKSTRRAPNSDSISGGTAPRLQY